MYQNNSLLSCADSDNSPVAILPAPILYVQGILTVVINCLFCVSVLTSAPLRTCPHYLLVSNSVADIGVGFFLLPFSSSRWLPDPESPPLPVSQCIALFTLGTYLNAVSVAHWAAIAVERLMRIYYTEIHLRWAKKLLPFVVILCWALPTLPTFARRLVPLVAKTYPYNPNISPQDICHLLTTGRCQCGYCVSKSWANVAMLVEFFIPLIVIVLCYAYILVATSWRIKLCTNLRREVVLHQPASQCVPWISLHLVLKSPEFRSIRLYVGILLGFCITMLPYSTNRMVFIFRWGDAPAPVLDPATAPGDPAFFILKVWAPDMSLNVTEAIAYANALVNPVLLFLFQSDFRKSCFNLFYGVCGRLGLTLPHGPYLIERRTSLMWFELARQMDKTDG